MWQRVLVAACLILTLTSMSASALVWHQSSRALSAAADATHRVAGAQAADQAKIAKLLAQSESTIAEILKQLQTMAKGVQPPQSLELIPVTFKLTLETLDGPPAVGYEVSLEKGSGSLFDRGINRESDSSGLVDFGVIHPGNWEFAISKSRDDQHEWKCSGNISVMPGDKFVKTIVCPREPPLQSLVRLRVQWPPDLADKNLSMAASFVQGPTTVQASLNWKVVNSIGGERSLKILWCPGSVQSELGGATKLDLWHRYDASNPFGAKRIDGVQRILGDIHSQVARSKSDEVAIEEGCFLLRELVVLRPYGGQNAAVKRDRLEVLAHTGATETSEFGVTTYTTDADDGNGPLGSPWPLHDFNGRVAVPRSYWRQLEGHFLVRSGQVNEWPLPLPDELTSFVRERLGDIQNAEPGRPSGTLGVVRPAS
jgi:hypothetical protein